MSESWTCEVRGARPPLARALGKAIWLMTTWPGAAAKIPLIENLGVTKVGLSRALASPARHRPRPGSQPAAFVTQRNISHARGARGAAQDSFDVIDLSDNELRKLGNFPMMRRLETLLLHNNQIARIDSDIGEHLPALETLMLTNNYVSHFSDIDALATLPKLHIRGRAPAPRPRCSLRARSAAARRFPACAVALQDSFTRSRAALALSSPTDAQFD